jgi:hypothetical protein
LLQELRRRSEWRRIEAISDISLPEHYTWQEFSAQAAIPYQGTGF